MGDGCYLRIEVKDSDVERFKKAFPYELYREKCHYHDTSEFIVEEANYAYYDEIIDMAQYCIPFLGEHGPGESYGSGTFVCFGGEVLFLDSAFESGPFCEVYPNGKIDMTSLMQAKQFYFREQQVYKYFRDGLFSYEPAPTIPTCMEDCFVGLPKENLPLRMTMPTEEYFWKELCESPDDPEYGTLEVAFQMFEKREDNMGREKLLAWFKENYGKKALALICDHSQPKQQLPFGEPI